MSGFATDPAALEELARRLEEAAEDHASTAAEVASAGAADLGAVAVSGAFASLTGGWADRIRAVERDFTTAAGSVRAAAKVYRAADADAAEELGRADA